MAKDGVRSVAGPPLLHQSTMAVPFSLRLKCPQSFRSGCARWMPIV